MGKALQLYKAPYSPYTCRLGEEKSLTQSNKLQRLCYPAKPLRQRYLWVLEVVEEWAVRRKYHGGLR